ncbi:MAG: class II aldolase/adducin family protein [Thermodesulfobacteriota bacterium]
MKELTKGELNYYRQQLAEFSRRSFERHLVGGTGGNLSVRIPHTDRVLITPTGISLGDVKPEENILVDLAGKVLESPMGLKGSKETSFHLAAFRSRPDVGAVAHVHPPYATAYSNLGGPLPLATVQARLTFKQVPCVECFPPGSSELCDCVTEGIQIHPEIKALLMKEHGILTLGTDLMHAFYLADLLEDTAKIAYLAANIQKR